MAKTRKTPKAKAPIPDFKRPKRKLGKKLKPANVTPTHFRTAKIDLRDQKLEQSTDVAEQIDQTLMQTKHVSSRERAEAVNNLNDFLASHKSLFFVRLSIVFEMLCATIADDDPAVRNASQTMFSHVVKTIDSHVVEAHMDILVMRVMTCLTHLNPAVRVSVVSFVTDLCSHCPQCLAPHAAKLFQRIGTLLIDAADPTTNTRDRFSPNASTSHPGRPAPLCLVLGALRSTVLLLNPLNKPHKTNEPNTLIIGPGVVGGDSLLYWKQPVLHLFELKDTRTSLATVLTPTFARGLMAALFSMWIETTHAIEQQSQRRTKSQTHRGEQTVSTPTVSVQVAVDLAATLQTVSSILGSAVSEAIKREELENHILPHINLSTKSNDHQDASPAATSTRKRKPQTPQTQAQQASAQMQQATTKQLDKQTLQIGIDLCGVILCYVQHTRTQIELSSPIIATPTQFAMCALDSDYVSVNVSEDGLGLQVVKLVRRVVEILATRTTAGNVLSKIFDGIVRILTVCGDQGAATATDSELSWECIGECMSLVCDVLDPLVTKCWVKNTATLNSFAHNVLPLFPRVMWALQTKKVDTTHLMLRTLCHLANHGLYVEAISSQVDSFTPLFYAQIHKRAKSSTEATSASKKIPGPFVRVPTQVQLSALSVCCHFQPIPRTLGDALVHMIRRHSSHPSVVHTVVSICSHSPTEHNLIDFAAQSVSLLVSMVWWPARPAKQGLAAHHNAVIESVAAQLAKISGAIDLLLETVDALKGPKSGHDSLVNVFGAVQIVHRICHQQQKKPQNTYAFCRLLVELASLTSVQDQLQGHTPVQNVGSMVCSAILLIGGGWATVAEWLAAELRTAERVELLQGIRWLVRTPDVGFAHQLTFHLESAANLLGAMRAVSGPNHNMASELCVEITSTSKLLVAL